MRHVHVRANHRRLLVTSCSYNQVMKFGRLKVGFILVAAIAVSSCGPKELQSEPQQNAGPAVGQMAKLADGVTKQIIQLDPTHHVWVYKPAKIKGKCPLILIGPAGTPLIYGMTVSTGDSDEHTPYARAGCIVVSYDISGPYIRGEGRLENSVRAFSDANLGVDDAKRALTYALKSIPEVDSHRIIVVGHSSAATLALQAALADDRIQACVAYAPVVDVEARIGKNLTKIDRTVTGFAAKAQAYSPANHIGEIHKPLFLFHADDDDNVPTDEIRRLAKGTKTSKLVEVPKGGHYNSMIQQGIPAAIEWMKSQGFVDK